LNIIYFVLCFFILIYLLFIIGVSNHVYRKLFFRKKRTVDEEIQNLINKNLISEDYYKNLDLKEISITAVDDYKLYGYLTKCENSIGCVILSHGISCNHATMLHHVGFFKKQNYDVLLIDQRGHGKCSKTISTYGFKEKGDMSLWISYLKNLGYKKVGILGHSMGASIALLTCSEEVKPSFVIAESGFSNLKELVAFMLKRNKIPHRMVIFTLNLICRLLNNFRLSDIDIIKSIKNTNIPLLFIHGDKDRLIPYEMSKHMSEITKSNLYIAKDCRHHIYRDRINSIGGYEIFIQSFINSL
jgi:pimeloyl-ACP methyl ester carboxylesterase